MEQHPDEYQRTSTPSFWRGRTTAWMASSTRKGRDSLDYKDIVDLLPD